MEHIKIRRMWEYAHYRLELSRLEVVHISECKFCLRLFNICVKANDPDKAEREYKDERRRTA